MMSVERLRMYCAAVRERPPVSGKLPTHAVIACAESVARHQMLVHVTPEPDDHVMIWREVGGNLQFVGMLAMSLFTRERQLQILALAMHHTDHIDQYGLIGQRLAQQGIRPKTEPWPTGMFALAPAA